MKGRGDHWSPAEPSSKADDGHRPPATRRGGFHIRPQGRQPLTGAYRMRSYDCHKAAKEEAHHDIFR